MRCEFFSSRWRGGPRPGLARPLEIAATEEALVPQTGQHLNVQNLFLLILQLQGFSGDLAFVGADGARCGQAGVGGKEHVDALAHGAMAERLRQMALEPSMRNSPHPASTSSVAAILPCNAACRLG